MDQLREGPGTGSRRGRFAAHSHSEAADVDLTGDVAASRAEGEKLARALAAALRQRQQPTVTDPDQEQKYGLRLRMGPRGRPFSVTAHHDGSFTVTKESTARSGNPYRAEALSTRNFRFDSEPTTSELVAELTRTFHGMRWWS